MLTEHNSGTDAAPQVVQDRGGLPPRVQKRFDTQLRTDTYKAGMRKLASGVSLITGSLNGKQVGLIATAVTSVCAEPPTLLICVNQDASAHDAIDVSGHFCVNLVAADDLDIAKIFSSSSRREERFKTGAWQDLPSGSPMLLSSTAAFDCRIIRRMPFQSHTIFFGEVLGVHTSDGEVEPLVYMESAFRRLGLPI